MNGRFAARFVPVGWRRDRMLRRSQEKSATKASAVIIEMTNDDAWVECHFECHRAGTGGIGKPRAENSCKPLRVRGAGDGRRALCPYSVGVMAAALANRGQVNEAQPLLAGLRGDAYGGPVGLAVYYLALGEIEQAVEWSAKAVERRYAGTSGARSDAKPFSESTCAGRDLCSRDQPGSKVVRRLSSAFAG